MALGILMLLLYVGTLTTSTAGQEQTAQVVENFHNNSLNTIPNLSENITKLILSNKQIKLSSEDIGALSKYKNLTELDLSSNVISVLPKTLLSSLPALRVLNLSHNNLSVLEPQALIGSLTELDLSHNHILSLPQNVSRGLPNLERLSLQGNKIRTLEKETITASDKLQWLALEDNPWNCSCEFLSLVKRMNSTGLLTSTQATCQTPKELFGKSILDGCMCSESTTASSPSVTTQRTSLTSAQSSMPPKTSNDSLSGKDLSGVPLVGNTWKFLVGVVIFALCTSMVILCAVKSPSWYKLIFNYRHRRLREEEGPRVLTKGRYSNFSLETEQTETSAQELEEGLDGELRDDEEVEDDDGFIEDRYIEPGDYKDQNES